MPYRSPRTCTYPGCTELVTSGSRCSLHAKKADEARGSAVERGYGSRWRKIRYVFLWKHPWCLDPFGDHDGAQVSATQVDHIIPRNIGGTDNDENLQALCDHCHSKKTAMEDGGFGNQRGGRQKSFDQSKLNRAPLESAKMSPIKTG